MVSHRRWRDSIFIGFLLFGFCCGLDGGGGGAFVCLISMISSLFKSVGVFCSVGGLLWTKPSVWVGCFIKWQTGSLYLANASRGRQWRRLPSFVCCERGWMERNRRTFFVGFFSWQMTWYTTEETSQPVQLWLQNWYAVAFMNLQW